MIDVIGEQVRQHGRRKVRKFLHGTIRRSARAGRRGLPGAVVDFTSRCGYGGVGAQPDVLLGAPHRGPAGR